MVKIKRIKKSCKGKDVERMWVPIHVKTAVLEDRACNPKKFRTNYDVFDDWLDKLGKKKKKDDFFPRF